MSIEEILTYSFVFIMIGGALLFRSKLRSINKHNKELYEHRIEVARINIPILLQGMQPNGIRDSIKLLEEAGTDLEVIKNFKARRTLIHNSVLQYPGPATQELMHALIEDIVTELNKL